MSTWDGLPTNAASPVFGAQPGRPVSGYQRVKHLVCTYLQNNLNITSSAIRTLYQLPAPTATYDPLPDVTVFLPDEPPALDAGNLPQPFQTAATALLYVSCTETQRMSFSHMSSDGTPEYNVYYPVNVLTWVKGIAWEDTIRSRDNLATSVKATLMRDYTLGNTLMQTYEPSGVQLPTGDSNVHWDINTFQNRANAWETQEVRGARHIGGIQTSFVVMLRETLTVPNLGIIGTAEDLVLDIGFLGPAAQ